MRINSKPSEALFRKLKEELQFAGFAVVESYDAAGYPKLNLNVDEASVSIAQFDAVSKDILGNDMKASHPHSVNFASRNDAMSTLKASQIMDAISKKGVASVYIQIHATVLATAEAAQPVGKISNDVAWSAHGV